MKKKRHTYKPSPAASRPGQDQAMREGSQGKGPRGAASASGTQLVWLDQLGAHPMAMTVQLQLNPRAKPFVPTVKANKLLQHRRGKREEGEAPVSKHQTQLGHVRWASRRGEGEPNPSRETKNSCANGGRNWRPEVYAQKKKLARKKRRRGKTGRRAAR